MVSSQQITETHLPVMPTNKPRKAPQLKIERGIPVPKAQSRLGYVGQLRALKPGDSVLFDKSHRATTIRSRAFAAFGTAGYAVRTMKDGSIRLWRIK